MSSSQAGSSPSPEREPSPDPPLSREGSGGSPTPSPGPPTRPVFPGADVATDRNSDTIPLDPNAGSHSDSDDSSSEWIDETEPPGADQEEGSEYSSPRPARAPQSPPHDVTDASDLEGFLPSHPGEDPDVTTVPVVSSGQEPVPPGASIPPSQAPPTSAPPSFTPATPAPRPPPPQAMFYPAFASPMVSGATPFAPGMANSPVNGGWPYPDVNQLQQHHYLVAQQQAHQQQQNFMAQMNQMQEAMFQQQQQLMKIQEQVERRQQFQIDSANKRLRRLEENADDTQRSQSVSFSLAQDKATSSRRHSVFIGKVKKEYDAETIEKSLFRFKFDQKFSGQQTEDVDAFLRSFERAVHSKEASLWPLFLDRQLSGQAATAFQSEFPDLYTTEYSEAVKFLRQRYRSLRHLHNTFVSILDIKQTGSVSKYFNYLDTLLYKLSGVDEATRYQTLLVSLMAANMKPHISKKILEDSSKLRAGYTLSQLKEDALSIEAAAKDADTSEKGRIRSKTFRQSISTVESPEYTAYVADLKSSGKVNDEAGPRPAYDHPEWYRRDGNSCRFCKTMGHNAAICTKLYKKVNDGKEMPATLLEANRRILKLSSD